MWLDEDEGDGLIERELYEMVSLRQKKQKSGCLHSTHYSETEKQFEHFLCTEQYSIHLLKIYI